MHPDQVSYEEKELLEKKQESKLEMLMSVSRESEDLRWIKRKSEQDITGSKLGLSPRRRSIEKNKIQLVLTEEPDA